MVWEVTSEELPELGIRWFAGIQVLPTGNILLCNAGGKVPLAEINREKKVVWKAEIPGTQGAMGHGIQRLDLPWPPLK
jgi:hypothetical protein